MTSSYDDSVRTIADLLDRPGTSRRVDLTLAVPDDVALALVEVVGPVTFDGILESVVDGILVRGRLETEAHMSCARCLGDIRGQVFADVVELFGDHRRQPVVAEGDDVEELDPGYEIREGMIDLEIMLRDAIMPTLPYQPLCRPDCAGLCARCGANLNQKSCGCVDADPDPRWAPLTGLHLPER